MHKYILKDKTPVRVFDIIEWATWFETTDLVVKKTHLPGHILVLTVFCGINFGSAEAPLLFDTKIFGGKHDQYIRRYPTWEAAEAGHEETLKMIRKH